jgi:hypothetical protein
MDVSVFGMVDRFPTVDASPSPGHCAPRCRS